MQDSFYEEYLSRPPSGFSVPLIIFWHKRMLRMAEHLGITKGKLLEVGFGFGFFASQAKKCGYEYSAVDGSFGIVKRAKQDGYTAYLGFIPPMPPDLEKSSQDIVWMSNVLEHAKDWAHAKAMLESVERTLTADGKICVIGPDMNKWGNLFWDVDWSHGYPTTETRVNQLLYEVGFIDIKSTTHTVTISHPLIRSVIDLLIALIPWRLLDVLFVSLFGKPYMRSFMSLMGYRQIMCVGTKP